jgi:hypothetical protein
MLHKLGFVDYSLPKPPIYDPYFNAWIKCDSMVTSWTQRTVSVQIAQSVAFFDTARELWQDIQIRYSTGDYFRFSDLLQAVHSMCQGDRDISDYFIHFKNFI